MSSWWWSWCFNHPENRKQFASKLLVLTLEFNFLVTCKMSLSYFCRQYQMILYGNQTGKPQPFLSIVDRKISSQATSNIEFWFIHFFVKHSYHQNNHKKFLLDKGFFLHQTTFENSRDNIGEKRVTTCNWINHYTILHTQVVLMRYFYLYCITIT